MNQKQILLGLVLLIGTVALLAGGYVWKQNADAANDLRKEISLAKADGFWVDDLSELEPKGDPAQNAATYYRRALKLLPPLYDRHTSGPYKDFKITNYLAQLKPAMDLAEKGAQLAYFRFEASEEPKRIDGGKSLLTQVTSLVSCFTTRAGYEFNQGDKKAAYADLQTAAKIARQTNQHQRTDGKGFQMLMNEGDKIVLSTIAYFLSQAPETTSEAEVTLKTLGDPPQLQPLFREKLYQSFHTLDRPVVDQFSYCQKEGSERECRDLGLSKWWFIRARWQAGVVHFYRRVLEIARDDPRPHKVIEVTGRLENQGPNAPFDHEGIFLNPPWLAMDAKEYAVSVSWRRVLAQAIAILKSHTIPSKLPLTGEAMIDPTNNHPLHYLHTKTGFRVYGIGESGADFGGNTGGLSTDIVFNYHFRRTFPSFGVPAG